MNSTEKLIKNRYAPSDEVRSGGMSTVTRAFDIQEHRIVAVKRMKKKPDEMRVKESFNREYAALSELGEHDNIVSLLNVDIDENGTFLVLEWVEENLTSWIGRHGAVRWDEYYPRIGRPILDAIEFAQRRNWSHRDIKPKNILIAEDGTPKISDYGIAKQLDQPGLGLTFAGFQSQPFTPPESDSGEWQRSRDCFSWAATTVYCLTAKTPKDYGELAEMAAALDSSNVPVEIIELALSNTPAERPPLASGMLADLDSWQDRRDQQEKKEQVCNLIVQQDCLKRAIKTLNAADGREVENIFEQELNEAFAIRRLEDPNSLGWRVSAVTWVFEMIRAPSGDGNMYIVKAWPASPADVERYREVAFQPKLRFVFHRPREAKTANARLDEIFIELAQFEALSQHDAEQAARARIFRLWYSFLRAKADFEASKANAIEYIDYRINESSIALTTELPTSTDIIGQSRVIRLTSSKRLFCEVIDINLDEVIISIISGDVAGLPRRGKLEVNTFAAEKAIERQRTALDAVNYDRAVSVRLKPLIVDPGSSRPPVSVTGIGASRQNFDDEKEKALKRALGLQDILAIQGPPGTGKTRLIEEIIVQYIDRYPSCRVLLSSQTHVALDNVIERVRQRQPDLNIVRVGKLDDPKISSSCRDLLLDLKAEAWSENIASKAYTYMTGWAEERGIERHNIEVGILAARLTGLLGQVEALKRNLQVAKDRARDIEERTEKKLEETGSAESEELDTEAEEAQEAMNVAQKALERLQEMTSQTRERLREMGGYGEELADSDIDDLKEWSVMLLGKSADEQKCGELLELQEDWILRVGKSTDFHAAMLASAQIVAGTCIGIAGVRGMATVAYDLCVIDEASKATATEILVPMSRSRRWIIVGDPAQLPPFFEDETVESMDEFANDEIRRTLLERFLEGLPDHSVIRLKNQYRMVKPIGDLISETFYDGSLTSPKTKADVTLTGAFPKPVTWLSTTSLADKREVLHGKSYRNEAECQVILETLQRIDFIARKRSKTYDIALIAGYMAQVKTLRNAIRDYSHEWSGINIACNTVDAFQGNEAEICIYSVTRSNSEGRLGFLREKPRLNVALSRGRSALIVVGDDEFCREAEGENPFRRVLEFVDMHPESCELRML